MSFIGEAFLISILWIFHTSLSLYLYITMYSSALCRIIKHLLGGKSSKARLEDLCCQLTKIPEHISFLMLENSLTEKSVAKLVLWSIVLGIQNISLYDHKGKLKDNQDLLLLELHQQVKKLKLDRQVVLTWQRGGSLDPADEQTVIIAKNGAMFPDVNGNGRITLNGHNKGAVTMDELIRDGTNGMNGISTKNGETYYLNGQYGVLDDKNGPQSKHLRLNGHHFNGKSELPKLPETLGSRNGGPRSDRTKCPLSINLTLLSAADGKYQMARLARKFCEKSTKVNSGEIDEDLVTQNIGKGLPDPSLLVRLGSLNSNDEYPPWELRLTEIHSIDTTAGLHLDQFSDVLRRYSRCEQRFGK